MDNKWNFNDFRLQILNYLIFMSRNVLHVRCYVRVNSTPQSHFPLQTGGVTLMLIWKLGRRKLFTPDSTSIDFLSPLHIDTLTI